MAKIVLATRISAKTSQPKPLSLSQRCLDKNVFLAVSLLFGWSWDELGAEVAAGKELARRLVGSMSASQSSRLEFDTNFQI